MITCVKNSAFVISYTLLCLISSLEAERFCGNNFDNYNQTAYTVTKRGPRLITIPELGRIRGKKVKVDNDDCLAVIQYLGIPYAEPPVGDRRWQKPCDKKSWRDVGDGILDATNFKAVCPQNVAGPLPNVLLPVWYRPKSDFMRNKTKLMDEDCLHLNIYVPAVFYAQNSRVQNHYESYLPVMIYFHGHTFSEGSGNFYDGSMLASYGKVIVVTFNYRLGALGFMSTMNENAPGNYGLWDQKAALTWVSNNIQYFGGDSQKITAFGSGSGAASIGLLMLTVHIEGKLKGNITTALFQRAIFQSGSAAAPWSLVKKPRKHAKAIAEHSSIGCASDFSAEMVNCLRNKPWSDIIAVPVRPEPFNLAFGPVVDGTNKFLSKDPRAIIDDGEFLTYPVIIGVSQGDGFGYVRDRLKTSASSNISDSDSFSYFSTKALYKESNFDMDVASFVETFYKGSNTPVTGIIEKFVKFMYTDWTDKDNPTGLKKSLMDLYTDRQWVEPAMKQANSQLRFRHDVYFYEFYHHPGTQSDRSWVNAAHGEEIPFVFGAPLLKSGYGLFPYKNYTREDSMISEAMMTYWTNFAKNGDPMKEKPQLTSFFSKMLNQFNKIFWGKFMKPDKQYLRISASPEILNHFRDDKVALWNDFLPDLAGKSRYPTLQPLLKPTQPSTSTMYRRTTKTITPNPALHEKWGQGGKSTEANEGSSISLQLSITLAVGFALLLVNIIAFAFVSYHNEKDKYKIQKLQMELKMHRKKDLLNKNASKSIANGPGKLMDVERETTSPKSLAFVNPDITRNHYPETTNKKFSGALPSEKPKHVINGFTLSPQSETGYRTMDFSLLKSGCNGTEQLLKMNNNGKSPYNASATDLFSPRKLIEPRYEETKQEDSIREEGFHSSKTGANCNESDINYWSRSDFGDDSGASGSGSSDPPEKLSSGQFSNTLPNRKQDFTSPALPAHTATDARPARCMSAMGILSRPDNDLMRQENISGGIYSLQQNYPRESALSRRGSNQYQTTSRRQFHGSVQNIPPNAREKDLPPLYGSFSIPRPCSKYPQITRPQSLISPSAIGGGVVNRSKNDGLPVAISTYSSVTTKL